MRQSFQQRSAPSEPRRLRQPSLLKRRAGTGDLLLLTGLLRQLAACKAPLVEGLVRTAADCPNNQVSMHLSRLAEYMQAGHSLSEAMRQSPRFFPGFYIDLVELAETSDQLEPTLATLLHEIENQRKSGTTLRNQVGYITIVLAYVIFVSGLLSGSAFPVAEDVARSLQGAENGPPRFGRAVMHYTGFLSGPVGLFNKRLAEVAHGLSKGKSDMTFLEPPSLPMSAASILFGGAVLSALFVTAAMLLLRPCRYLSRFLPGIRRITLYKQWGHAVQVLSLLLARGMPLDRALDRASGADVGAGIRAALRRLSQRAGAGMALSEALAKEGWRVPESLCGAAEFGERSGSLPETLGRVSRAYRLRSERMMRACGNVLFPLAVMACGALVLAVNSRFFGLLTNTMDGILNQL